MNFYKKFQSLGALRTLLTMLCLTFALPIFAQVQISGNVVDEFGEPMIGVAVLEKGTQNGTVTDLDGNYALKVANGATLQFSFVGYEKQELKAANGLKVILREDRKTLEETVVVGYGVQKKSSLTGAVSQLKSEDMNARPILTADQALQGKTAGVTVMSNSASPGAHAQVRVRGIASNGTSNPLFIVDGRIDENISGIEPGDIESMEVLKDAASAAIYGAAAGNGVILITTKKGKGQGKIGYDLTISSQSLGHSPSVMNAKQYLEYYNDLNIDLSGNWDGKTDTDWAKETFENSLMQRHNFTYQAGSDKGNIYASLSYMKNDGMIKGPSDYYRRITGMMNASWKVKDWLELSYSTQVEDWNFNSVAEGDVKSSVLLAAIQQDPLYRSTYSSVSEMPAYMQDIANAHPDGELAELLKDGKGNYYGISSQDLTNINPLVMINKQNREIRGRNINGSANINITPFKGLTMTSRFAYKISDAEINTVAHDYYYRSTSYQDYLSVSGYFSNGLYTQWENFANYNKQISKSNISLTAGTSWTQNRSASMSGNYKGAEGELGFTKDLENFWYFANATGTSIKTLSGAEPVYTKKLAYFGRASYSYDNKYDFQFTFRADAADNSLLPIDKRWGYFPGVSAGWTISQENFMADTKDWLDQLKIRASWGQNGSTSSLGSYMYASVMQSDGNYPYSIEGATPSYVVAWSPSATGNQQLKWETSEQLDLGVDIRLMNNRLNFTMDYFNKETKDLIVTGITPSTVVGVTVSPMNAGAIVNRGWEFELGWQDRVGKDFNYSIRGTLSTLHNEVTQMHESLKAIDGDSYSNYGTITRFEKGYPAWHFYGYRYAGVNPEDGTSLFYDANGNKTSSPSDADKTDLGSGISTLTYGLTLSANWKGLDFIVFGSGAAGAKIFCCVNDIGYKINRLTAFTEDRWRKAGDVAKNPSAEAQQDNKWLISDASIFDGSYFKIKQIQVGYTVPKKYLSKAYLGSLRAYCSLEDFFTFTDYPGFDPETTGNSSYAYSIGVDKGSYPNSRKVVFGLNVTF